MIPKIIHYCWFSGDKKSRFIKKCIKSWKRCMPDYQIKCWDADSFDFDSVPFVKQAYNEKKWAFVADYVRLYALYTEGGIYLDSDVRTFKSFDSFLYNDFFIGTEPLPNNCVELESAIMGAIKGHPYVKECLDYYRQINFRKENGEIFATCPIIMTSIAEKYGYVAKDENQLLEANIQVYSRKYFGHLWGTNPGQLYAIHYFNTSWLESKHGWLYRYCKQNDFMRFYFISTKFLKKFKK